MGIKALERLRPGREFTLPASASNTPQPGDVIKFTFTSAASAEQRFRFPASAAMWPLNEQYLSVKVTADCHIAFGPAGSVADPTNAGALLQPSDSWQDFQLNVDDQSFKIKGDSTGGDVYIILSAR
jgi:hypothetical protein